MLNVLLRIVAILEILAFLKRMREKDENEELPDKEETPWQMTNTKPYLSSQ